MMKKITLLFALILGTTLVNAQQFYFQDEFIGGDMTQWTTIDADGDGNNWAPANSAQMSATGDCVNSDSWTSALGGLNPDNYLVTAAPIVFPTIADLSLKFRVGTFQQSGLFIDDQYSVYLSTGNTAADILAGTLIYNGLLSDVMVADQADLSASFFDHEFDMAAYQGQTLYLTFRHHDTFDHNSVLIGGVSVSSPFADDLVLNRIVSPVTQGTGCQAGVETVTANITNNGANPVTTFNATYVITNLVSGNLVDSIVETITVPSMALGDNADFSFATSTSDISPTDSVYNVQVFVSLTGDQDLSSDTVLANVASIATQAIPYTTGFEIFDGTFSSIPEIDAWGWATEDLNTNGDGFEPTIFAAGSALVANGDCALFVDQANTDWAFSPCLTTVVGTVYRVAFQVATGSFTDGSPVPEVIEVGHGNGANSAAMTIIRLDSLNDNANFSTIVYDFVATDVITNIGIHKVSSTFIVTIDDLIVTDLPAPTATINNSSVNTCSGIATVDFTIEAGNEYVIDWGDGTIDTVMISPATHTYTATGVQNISLTASNLSGTSMPAMSTVDNTLAAPDATFTYSQSGTADLTVSFTASEASPCNTYTWDFGNGNTDNGLSSNFAFTENGTFPVTLSITNSAGSNSTTQDIIITGVGINDIEFVNGINIFPNPTTDVLNIAFDLNSNQDVNINLVSIDGKEVAQKSVSNASNISATFNTTSLASGLYILNITTAEGIFTSNIIVK